MPTYRPPISRDQYYLFEGYLYNLVQFTESVDFKMLNYEKRKAVEREVVYFTIALDILNKLFEGTGNERKVAVWKIEEDDANVAIFSCIASAASALGCNKSKAVAVCKKSRPHTGGYKFMYLEDFDKSRNLSFNPSSIKFKLQ